jgi:hypothetical protein
VILRQPAIREDAERTASEQRQQLNFATVNAFLRLAALEKQAQEDAKRPATGKSYEERFSVIRRTQTAGDHDVYRGKGG